LVLKSGYDGTEELRRDLTNHIRNTVGPIATPDEIHFVSRLPKTRSGKIMRRLLKSIASDTEIVGDISTIEDEASVEEVKQTYLELHKKSKSRAN
jgi:acetyl-CoA synthetase